MEGVLSIHIKSLIDLIDFNASEEYQLKGGQLVWSHLKLVIRINDIVSTGSNLAEINSSICTFDCTRHLLINLDPLKQSTQDLQFELVLVSELSRMTNRQTETLTVTLSQLKLAINLAQIVKSLHASYTDLSVFSNKNQYLGKLNVEFCFSHGHFGYGYGFSGQTSQLFKPLANEYFQFSTFKRANSSDERPLSKENVNIKGKVSSILEQLELELASDKEKLTNEWDDYPLLKHILFKSDRFTNMKNEFLKSNYDRFQRVAYLSRLIFKRHDYNFKPEKHSSHSSEDLYHMTVLN